jgi:hypothetical protein
MLRLTHTIPFSGGNCAISFELSVFVSILVGLDECLGSDVLGFVRLSHFVPVALSGIEQNSEHATSYTLPSHLELVPMAFPGVRENRDS